MSHLVDYFMFYQENDCMSQPHKKRRTNNLVKPNSLKSNESSLENQTIERKPAILSLQHGCFLELALTDEDHPPMGFFPILSLPEGFTAVMVPMQIAIINKEFLEKYDWDVITL